MATTEGIGPDGGAAPARPDWQAAERSPEFRQLVRKRNRFVYPATVFFLAWYIGFILLAGYAPDFMGESVYEGLTVGYVLALSQFVMTWVLSWLYLRKSDREFDPLAEEARAVALRTAARGPARPGATANPGPPDQPGSEVQR